jgi:predicted transcriptional regulator
MAFTLTLRPEIETELKERAEAERRSVHKTVELAVEEYLRRTAHRAEVMYHVREVVAEDREFLSQLGDR